MSESKHTPGPWKVDEVRTSSGRAYRIGAGEMLVAGKGCCIIYDDYPDGDRSNERTANAKLIAAAPETAEKLQRAEELCRELANDLAPVLQAMRTLYGDARNGKLTLLTAIYGTCILQVESVIKRAESMTEKP